jgi:hypothetical protein
MECEAAVYDVHEESNVLWMSEIARHGLEHSRYQSANVEHNKKTKKWKNKLKS